MKKQQTHFETLVWKQLDQDISDEEFAEFHRLLEEDAERRALYQHMVEVHQGLHNHSQFADKESESTRIANFVLPQPPVIIRKGIGWRWATGITAILCLGLILDTALNQPRTLEVEYIALREADIRGANIQVGDQADTRMTHLMSGAVALNFPSKTQAIIEGPAFYQIQSNESIMLSSGTITVHHEGEPGGFKVITPLGEIVDMGTKFGVTIGNGVTDSMVMMEVYEGEVVYNNADGTRISILEGDGYAILGNSESQSIVSDLNGDAIKVSGTFSLSGSAHNLKRVENLALGKPVTASSYFNHPREGEVFGPAALTDNRVADSGSPWDWSFWLAKAGDSGSATIDLLQSYHISRVELQNTRNRNHNDRGLKDFIIEVSTDGTHFTQIYAGHLDRITEQMPEHYQFQSVEFASTPARYVRITGITNYEPLNKRHPGSGGLNEVRIYE